MNAQSVSEVGEECGRSAFLRNEPNVVLRAWGHTGNIWGRRAEGGEPGLRSAVFATAGQPASDASEPAPNEAKSSLNRSDSSRPILTRQCYGQSTACAERTRDRHAPKSSLLIA
jgi:hypothetical protein